MPSGSGSFFSNNDGINMLEITNDRVVRGILPKKFNQKTMYAVIDNLIDHDLNATSSKVTLDFSNLNAIGIGGVAVLSNVIELLKSSGVDVKIDGISTCGARKKLEHSGFISTYAKELLNNKLPERNKFVLPLALVAKEHAYSYILNKIIPWMRTHLNLTKRSQLATITAAFQEIFNNIIDHSTVNIGCICASVDEKLNLIQICISDFGVGIPNNVKKYSPDIKNDNQAIAKACEQGFTTKSLPTNRGVGLYLLINNIVHANSGTVTIYSGEGMYQCLKNNDRIKHRTLPENEVEGVYPGTLIFMTLPIDKFAPDEAEDFDWDDEE